MSSHKFNITLRMVNVHAFCWLKDYAEGTIMLHTALNAIAITLKEEYEDDEWMDLTFHMVMDPSCWHDVEEVFMRELGITEPESHTIEGLPSARLAETEEERNDAITRWIKPQVGSHLDLVKFLQLQTELQTMHKVLNQYKLSGLMTPVDYDGASSCMDHILKALGLNSDWGKKCHKTLVLLLWYGKDGTRYEDSRVVNMIQDPAPLQENSMDDLLKLLKFVDCTFTEGMLSESPPQPIGAVISSTSFQGSLSANRFINVAAVKNDEEDERDEEENGTEELIHHPQPVGPSGKQSYHWTIDAIIEQLNRKTSEEATFIKSPKMTQLPDGVALPPQKSIFIVDFCSASARIFAFQSVRLRGIQVTMLSWFPHRLYVEASSPLEVQQNLPPLHLHAHKPIVCLPPEEGTLLATFKAHKTLPHQSWVKIKRPALYKGDFGCMEMSDEQDAIIIVVPHQHPYDIPEHSNERMEFDVELARIANLPLVPISSPAGNVIGYTCSDQEFIHGLLRLRLSVHNLEIIEHPHPDDIKYHITVNFDRKFIEETVQLFSVQFWWETDQVEVQEGDLKGMEGALGGIDWDRQTATVFFEHNALDCSLHELHRKFNIGDGVKVIAGPFSRETSHIIVVNKGLIVLVVMQEGRTTENIEVSKFFMQSFSKDHVLSHSTDNHTADLAHPLTKGEALLGDLVIVCHGPYVGQRGSIEWINPDGFWVYFNDGVGSDEADEDSMTLVEPCHVHIEPVPNTLTLTRDKGYNVTVGDIVGVARGNYYHCEGVVKAVDLTNALLDIVCPVEGHQTQIPITFCCKIKERSENKLPKFVGHDIWVIGGEKKGCWAMLHSLGRTCSLVALFGHQLIQLKNDQITTLTSVLLNGGILPPAQLQALIFLHRQSFVTIPVAPHAPTPPPAPSEIPQEGPWIITPDDITAPPEGPWSPDDVPQPSTSKVHNTPDYGNVTWLFQDDYCDFSSIHLGFNSREYNNSD
ncbi:hypothetical protein SCLCIDRAFT_23585 [Scleroderma citrinum Foug A]|uniref:Uncharacterized protein n=1 Tax=Scleroderma citrinum Foug A TaxID=1036808 RepID=A0A0C3E8B0_9AGAM|nr:hypothetical protein SCLCIDRAFT_23585 [Scleroderma citrinum Foug A]